MAGDLRRRFAVGVALGLSLCGFAESAHSQGKATVTVRVREADSPRLIKGATVQLIGAQTALTDSAGTVRLRGIAPGRYRLVVAAFGYVPLEQTLAVDKDVALDVRLNVEPIQLDPLQSRMGLKTMRLEILDAESRRGIPNAEMVAQGTLSTSDYMGYLKKAFAANDSVVIEITAIGYLPGSLFLNMSRDTALQVYLRRDPVGQAMVAQQIKRLDNVLNAVPHAVRRVGRDDLLRHVAAGLKGSLQTLGVAPERLTCLMVDGNVIHDYKSHPPPPGFSPIAAYLDTILPETIERVEYIARGQMLRVYSYMYIRTSLPRRSLVPPIVDGHCG